MVKDKIQIFGERLKKVIEGINTLKTYGMDEEILICWLRIKTGLSQADIKSMIKSQEEFYEKFIAMEIEKKI